MDIERTPEAQRGFNGMTTPVTSASTPSRLTNGAAMDPFADDTPLECGLENPEACESCQ